jgi:hypothetical protein
LRLRYEDRTQHVVDVHQHVDEREGRPSSKSKVAPRDEDAKGPNPTIASYIAENNIQEAPVKRGDPGSPHHRSADTQRLGPAGADTPEWAYGAIVYNGPDAGDNTPSIVALVSKLTGNVDPQRIIDWRPVSSTTCPGGRR